MEQAMGKNKNAEGQAGEAGPETGPQDNSFSGHVLNLRMGDAVEFELLGKKGKRRTCKLDRTHPLFGLVADTLCQAYWVDRKVTVAGTAGADVLDIVAIQVGAAPVAASA
jgi:hypothetical protein